MRGYRWVFILLLPVGAASTALGQQVVIQQPQFHYTTANTTVLVPDQGEVLLGGINSASEGRNEQGLPLLGNVPVLGRPFKNVGIGRSTSASRLSVKAYIHDFQAMDEALLAEAARRRGEAPPVALVGGRQSPALAADARFAANIAELQTKARDKSQSQRSEIAKLIERAQAAEADGRPRVAAIYYRIAFHDAKEPDVRAMARARLDALSGRNEPKVAASAALAPARE